MYMPQAKQKSNKSKIEDEKPGKEETIKIRVSVFFDGTLNNRTNINQRLIASTDGDGQLTEEEQKAALMLSKNVSQTDKSKAVKRYGKFGATDSEDENSYEGYYTNVVIMEKYVELPSEPKKLHLAIYIEGSGSINKKADQTSGYAFAIWESGIPHKVQQGIESVVSKIKKNHLERDVKIEEIALDIFGFSRGAAAARNFIHEALDGENAIKKQLTSKYKYKVKSDAVKVCFVGLYDTVSTYGFWKTATGIGESNTKSLKLDSIAKAERVIQLAAANEHRKYFSLTNINSARGNSREIFLPGVHSDIGGGYRDNQPEKQVIFEEYGYSREDALKEIDALIEAGWYNENELFLDHTMGYEGDEGDETSIIRVVKENVSNKYSRIPLHIMANYARKNKIKLLSKLDEDEAIPDELTDIQGKLLNYITKTKKSKAQHWHGNKEGWLCKLRHDYFHFSARIKTGHTPRYIKGKRGREIIKG